jgi:hypothetical protein
LKIGGFLRFAANSLDGAAGVLGGFLALKTEHDVSPFVRWWLSYASVCRYKAIMMVKQ